MDSNEFGVLLKKFRNQAGYKQKHLAVLIKCQVSDLSRFETGKKKPSQAVLNRIVTVFKSKISEDDLKRLWKAANKSGDPISSDIELSDPQVLIINQIIADAKKHGTDQKLIDQIINDLVYVIQANFNVQNSKEYLASREWEKGLIVLDDASDQLKVIDKLHAEINFAKAKAHYSQGHFIKAIKEYNTALRIYTDIESYLNVPEQNVVVKQQIGRILMGLGDVYRRISDYDDAKEYYEQSEYIFSRMTDRYGRFMLVNSIRKQAAIMNYLGQAHEAIAMLKRSSEIRILMEDKTLDYKNLQHLAWSYRILGEWDAAIQHGRDALKLAQDHNDVWDVLKAHIYLGDSYRLIRNLEEAEYHYQEAKNIFQEIQDNGRYAKLQEGMILLGLGRVYLKEPSKRQLAEKYLRKCLQIHYDLGEEFMVATAQNELGELYMVYKNEEDPYFYLMQSANTLKRLKTSFSYLSALVSLCKYYYQKEDYKKIEEIMTEARRIDEKPMDTHLARISLIAGKAKIKEGKPDEAEALICNALHYSLHFNRYVFNVIWRELSDEIDIYNQDKNFLSAQTILNICKQCAASKEWESDHKDLFDELNENIKAKEVEIDWLRS